MIIMSIIPLFITLIDSTHLFRSSKTIRFIILILVYLSLICWKYQQSGVNLAFQSYFSSLKFLWTIIYWYFVSRRNIWFTSHWKPLFWHFAIFEGVPAVRISTGTKIQKCSCYGKTYHKGVNTSNITNNGKYLNIQQFT